MNSSLRGGETGKTLAAPTLDLTKQSSGPSRAAGVQKRPSSKKKRLSTNTNKSYSNSNPRQQQAVELKQPSLQQQFGAPHHPRHQSNAIHKSQGKTPLKQSHVVPPDHPFATNQMEPGLEAYIDRVQSLPRKPSSSPVARDMVLPTKPIKIHSPSVDQLHQHGHVEGFSGRVETLQAQNREVVGKHKRFRKVDKMVSAPISPRQLARLNNSQELISTTEKQQVHHGFSSSQGSQEALGFRHHPQRQLHAVMLASQEKLQQNSVFPDPSGQARTSQILNERLQRYNNSQGSGGVAGNVGAKRFELNMRRGQQKIASNNSSITRKQQLDNAQQSSNSQHQTSSLNHQNQNNLSSSGGNRQQNKRILSGKPQRQQQVVVPSQQQNIQRNQLQIPSNQKVPPHMALKMSGTLNDASKQSLRGGLTAPSTTEQLLNQSEKLNRSQIESLAGKSGKKLSEHQNSRSISEKRGNQAQVDSVNSSGKPYENNLNNARQYRLAELNRQPSTGIQPPVPLVNPYQSNEDAMSNTRSSGGAVNYNSNNQLAVSDLTYLQRRAFAQKQVQQKKPDEENSNRGAKDFNSFRKKRLSARESDPATEDQIFKEAAANKDSKNFATLENRVSSQKQQNAAISERAVLLRPKTQEKGDKSAKHKPRRNNFSAATAQLVQEKQSHSMETVERGQEQFPNYISSQENPPTNHRRMTTDQTSQHMLQRITPNDTQGLQQQSNPEAANFTSSKRSQGQPSQSRRVKQMNLIRTEPSQGQLRPLDMFKNAAEETKSNNDQLTENEQSQQSQNSKVRHLQFQRGLEQNLLSSKQQKEALQAVLRAANLNKLFPSRGSKTTPSTQAPSPREKRNLLEPIQPGAKSKQPIETQRNPFEESKEIQESPSKIMSQEQKERKKFIDLGFDKPQMRPTSPNTPHLTHIKQKNVVKKFAFATRVGFEKSGDTKVNEDAFILAPNIQERQSMHMFGICDGHGTYGRDAANFVKYALHLQVEQKFPKEGMETFESINRSLNDAFNTVQSQFRTNVQSPETSGSTACVLLVQGHKMITANVGNSRAICVDKYRKVRVLSEDHIPNLPPERRRVEQAGGRITRCRGGLKDGAYCVYTDSRDDKRGLDVSRSIGDLNFHRFGVTHEPEIKHFNVEEDDQILILASDGIWEKMTLQNVAQIAQAHYEPGQAEAAANAIVRRATQLWKDSQETVDDITCVIIFLDRKLIQKNIYSKQQLKLVEEEETRQKEIDDKLKLEKQIADEQAKLHQSKRRRTSSSRSSSRSISPVDALMETENIKDFTVQTKEDSAALKPILQKQAMASSLLLEDILAEDNIIQEDDAEIYTTQQTQIKSFDNMQGGSYSDSSPYPSPSIKLLSSNINLK